MRIRLHARGSGKWEKSGGQAAKFGLTTQEVLEAVEELKRGDALASFRLLHFHVGSQIPEIKRDQERDQGGRARLREAARRGRPARDPRRGRRPRRRLRRQQDVVRRVDELHARRSTRTTSSTSCARSAARRACPSPPSSPSRAARSSPTTRCSSARCAARTPPRTERRRPHGPAGRPRRAARDEGDPRRDDAEEPPRVLPRRPREARGALRALRPRLPLAAGARARRAPLRRDQPHGGPLREGGPLRPRGVRGPREEAGDEVHRQLLGLPVDPRLVGPRPALPRGARSTGSARSRRRARRSAT